MPISTKDLKARGAAYRQKEDPYLCCRTEEGKMLEEYWEGNPSMSIMSRKEKMHAYIQEQEKN